MEDGMQPEPMTSTVVLTGPTMFGQLHVVNLRMNVVVEHLSAIHIIQLSQVLEVLRHHGMIEDRVAHLVRRSHGILVMILTHLLGATIQDNKLRTRARHMILATVLMVRWVLRLRKEYIQTGQLILVPPRSQVQELNQVHRIQLKLRVRIRTV
jgi:hypothetical protein